ncbi:MAG: 6-hydroxymethylpterin diphosphokinase MptE-like protein [Rhodospirillales bacterium]
MTSQTVQGEGQGGGRYRANRSALVERFPFLAEHLPDVDDPGLEAAGLDLQRDDQGRLVNLVLGDGPLYPEAAPIWSKNQIEAYFNEPDRLELDVPALSSLSGRGRGFLGALTDLLDRDLGVRLSNQPDVDTGYGFVFGVGLGYHLESFLERARPRYLLIHEPVQALFVASLLAIDWSRLLDRARELDCLIVPSVGTDPAQAMRDVEGLLQSKGPTFLDGSYAFVHYPGWAVLEARKRLNETVKPHAHSKGFFDDEVLMMVNTYGNFRNTSGRFVERRAYRAQQAPLFIVGSGPSLDRDMAAIIRHKDRAVIYSCGTALGILLKNGIRPDFHVENENTPQLVRNLKDFSDTYGLRDIVFTGSTTVSPDMPHLFDRRWFYFRDGLSSTYLLNPGVRPLVGAGPLVANAAFSVALTLGFRDIYLFGCDCGRREDAGHHAGDVVYYQDGYDNWLPGEGLDLLETEFNREVPANFGGKALTTWYLDMSRQAMAALQRLAKVNLVNCSDGARIEGAKPLRAAAIKLAGAPLDRSRLMAGLESQLRAFEPGAPVDSQALARAVDRLGGFEAAFDRELQALKTEASGFWDMERRLIAFRAETADRFGTAFRLMTASYQSYLRLGAFAGRRIRDVGEREAFRCRFIDLYGRAIQGMARDSRRLLAAMAENEWPLPAVPDAFDGRTE